jgi:uncharacterized protein
MGKRYSGGNVHPFEFNGDYFALDVNTGSLFEIDEPAFYFISKLIETDSLESAEEETGKKFSHADDVRAEIEDLIRQGLLFSKPPNYFESELKLKSLCLNVAHACNFACKYCFAKGGNYGEKNALMDFNVAKRSIDFLHENSEGREHLEVDFFGGEPLLDFDVVKKTIKYARSTYPDKKWRFTLTTNGSLLTESMENFFYDNDVSLVLSLDGNKEVNDKFRILPDGRGTFDLILPNLRMVAEHRKESGGYYIRGTYTHSTLEISKTVIDLHNFGFKYISLEPVVTKDTAINIAKSDLPRLRTEYEKLAKEYVESQKEGEWHFFHFNVDLEAGPCIQKRIHGCGAGIEYMAVAPNGDIFPCHQFDGMMEMKLGNVFTGIDRPDLVERFRKANFLFNKKECTTCWARFYCSGGCLANNYVMNGDIFKPYETGCETQKMRIEAALYVQVKLRELGLKVDTTTSEEFRDSVK